MLPADTMPPKSSRWHQEEKERTQAGGVVKWGQLDLCSLVEQTQQLHLTMTDKLYIKKHYRTEN